MNITVQGNICQWLFTVCGKNKSVLMCAHERERLLDDRGSRRRVGHD